MLLMLAVLYIFSGLLLYIMQRHFLYFPTAAVQHNHDELKLSRDGVLINTTVLNKGMEQAIIYFGGNAEVVEHNAPAFSNLFQDHTVYLVNYRGYGDSAGRPQETDIYADALFIFDYLIPEHNDISVIGRSLGSGVATLLAAEREINKLVLITPFDSIQNVAKQYYPIFPISLILKDKYDSLGRVKSIKAETLIIFAEHDEVIHRNRTDRLVEAFPPAKIEVEMIRNANHNNISDHQHYHRLLSDFF